MTRLRTVSPQDAGIRRVRCGRGFRYLDAHDRPVGSNDLARARALVIPPAWTEVWICADDRGHLQAVGVDDDGRTQYLYHPEWREKRDAAKFDHVLEMAMKLPSARRRLRNELGSDELGRTQVLATAVLLIDLGCFRVGSESYAAEHDSHGLTTLERRHVRKDGVAHVFRFAAKSGVEQEIRIDDPDVNEVLALLVRRRRGADRLLAAKEGRRWVTITAADVNTHISDVFGLDATAKDFRTWNATVVAAASLAETYRATSKTGRVRQVRHAMQEAADLLGNTPTIARSSYVDPRVVDRFHNGRVADTARVRSRNGLDRAVLRLIRGR